MISQNHMSETYEHRHHLELSINQKGLLLLLFFFIRHVPKVTSKDVQSTKVSIFHKRMNKCENNVAVAAVA